MYTKTLILRFSKNAAGKPVVCHLTKDFDLTFNILNATIFPRKEGLMVLEISGTRKNYREGVKYLKAQGIQVQNAAQEVKRNKRKCTHCGACTAVCPTGALYIQRPEMSVEFNQSECSVCELCVPACPPRAMEVSSKKQAFFE